MNIFITGGTGLIGSRLVKFLLNQNHRVTILTRDAEKAKFIFGDQVNCCVSLSDIKTFDGYDVIINLAGEPIANRRWTKYQKEKLIQSRLTITQQLSRCIVASVRPPSVFISGSAVGYYGAQSDNIVSEESEAHKEFTYDLCQSWEASAQQAASDSTRVCLLRTGIVLSAEGGALSKMLLPFKLGFGSVLGNGKQYISWIHIDDMVGAIYHLLITHEAKGAFNMTAPEPVTNKIFSKTLAKVLRRPCLFFVPRFVLFALMGESATLLLDGQRVIPKKLEEFNYSFQYNEISEALASILVP